MCVSLCTRGEAFAGASCTFLGARPALMALNEPAWVEPVKQSDLAHLRRLLVLREFDVDEVWFAYTPLGWAIRHDQIEAALLLLANPTWWPFSTLSGSLQRWRTRCTAIAAQRLWLL